MALLSKTMRWVTSLAGRYASFEAIAACITPAERGLGVRATVCNIVGT